MPRIALAISLFALLAACSPSFGGSPQREVIVVPAGTQVICPSGRAPPC